MRCCGQAIAQAGGCKFSGKITVRGLELLIITLLKESRCLWSAMTVDEPEKSSISCTRCAGYLGFRGT